MLAATSSGDTPAARSLVPISRKSLRGCPPTIGSSRSSIQLERSPLMPRFLTRGLASSSFHSPPSVMLLPRNTMSLEVTGSFSKSERRWKLYSLCAKTAAAAKSSRAVRIVFFISVNRFYLFRISVFGGRHRLRTERLRRRSLLPECGLPALKFGNTKIGKVECRSKR